jgi:hypothetical protein
VAQVAVSFVLLVGAGLMIRSFQKLQNERPGFRTDQLLTMRVTPNFYKYQGRRPEFNAMWREAMRKVAEAPGVKAVATTTNAPFDPAGIAAGPGNVDFAIEGRPVSPGTLAPTVDVTGVSEGYFGTIGQPVLAGREFAERDDVDTLPVAVINDSMARHRWPGEDPVGRRVTFDAGKTWIEIVGVVGDVKEHGLDRPVSGRRGRRGLRGYCWCGRRGRRWGWWSRCGGRWRGWMRSWRWTGCRRLKGFRRTRWRRHG